MKRRVLIADNRQDHIPPRREALEQAGYEVLEAYTPEGAKALLDNRWIHVAVLDLRLRDDTDYDWSGIWVARNTDPMIPKIILTAFPENWKAVREALSAPVDGLPPAVEFLSKADEPDELLTKVGSCWARLGANEALLIDPPDAALTVVGLFEKEDWQELPHATLDDLKDEAEFLFRKLFPKDDCTEIRVEPYLRGRGGACTVLIGRKGLQGRLPSVVVKCGPRSLIRHEYENYKQYVQNMIPDWAQILTRNQETPRLGGVVYSFGSSEHFIEYYQKHKQLKIRKVLDRLRQAYEAWFALDPARVEDDLHSIYRELLGLDKGRRYNKVREWIGEVCSKPLVPEIRIVSGSPDSNDLGITIDKTHFPCPNPLSSIYGPCLFDQRRFPSNKRVTHGDLHGKNILVSQEGVPRLIDFERTGPGPELRDFAELESALYFDLLIDLPFQELFYAITMLLAPERLDEPISPTASSNNKLQKYISIVSYLRKLAFELTKGQAHILHHYTGLLFGAVKAAIYRTPPQEFPEHRNKRRAIAFLFASLICKRLNEWPRWEWPLTPQVSQRSLAISTSGTRPKQRPQGTDSPSLKKLPSEPIFDAFLSYNRSIEDEVKDLAQRLENESGLQIWLDKWNLVPGEPWQEAVEEALDDCATCVVFWGPKGLGPWQHEEMRAALARRVRERGYRVIPVLLPGCPEPEEGKMPSFLQRVTWVDFRKGLDDAAAFKKLVAGIRGVAPGPEGV